MHLGTSSLGALRLIDNHSDFVGLKETVQAEVLQRLEWMTAINNAPHRRKGSIVTAAAAALNVDESSVNRYLARFRSRGWRGLVDGRALANAAKGLPEAFKDYVRQLHIQNQRSTTGREVHRIVCERASKWRRTGDPAYAIPGYSTPPPQGPKGYPAGWSVDTIVRLRPEAYALAAARQGAKAADNFLPSILKTRASVNFGAVVFFDDQDYDNKVVAPGLSQRALRPQGFNALEYRSACFMDYSIRLRWWDMDQQQYKTLTGVEATWFIIGYLQNHGFRTDADGTVLVVEHGTMNGYDNQSLYTPDGHHSLADALLAVTGGKIRTERSGLFNKPAFAGMLFRPQSSGNPNFKAPLEGIFNLVRNRFAALPGAVGRNRDLKPAEQYGQDKYAEQLLKVWSRLDDRHREVLQFPILTAEQFGAAAMAVYDAINARRDHDLEGWARCGHVVPQFRWTADDRSPWLSQHELLELPEQARAGAEALMTLPGYVRQVNLAPIEVADLYRRELTKLPDHLIPLLIPVAWSREATVASDRTITISDQMLGPEPLRYVARFKTSDSATTLATGTKVRCYLNPHNPAKLYVCRTDGSWLGVLHQMTRAGFMDHEAIVGQLQERAELKADLDAAVRPHLDGLMQERTAMKRTNDRLAAGQPVLPEEIADARHEAGLKGVRTAAANRLQDRGTARDWDIEAAADIGPESTDPFADLPEESPLPPSFL